MKKIITGIVILLIGYSVYQFLYGKFFPYSPVILGFTKNEMQNSIIYIQSDANFSDFNRIDTLMPIVEKFHELKFLEKPKIFIFKDSLEYINHSPSRARFCAFPTGRLVVSPWALKEAESGLISLEIYLRHELSHVLLYQHKEIFTEFQFPDWLMEGIAIYSANQMGARFYLNKSETYRAINRGNFIPPFDFKTKKEEQIKLDVENKATFPYSEFACMVDYLVEKYGRERFLIYMKVLLKVNVHDEVFKKVFGLEFKEFMVNFKKYVSEIDNLGIAN